MTALLACLHVVAVSGALYSPPVCRRGPSSIAVHAKAALLRSAPIAAMDVAAIAKYHAADADAQQLTEPDSWQWMDGSGAKLSSFSDSVLPAIRSTQEDRAEVEVHVGCDSAVQQGHSVIFAVVICVISKSGGGGRYFYARRVEPRRIYPVLQTRLLREVELSLTAADALRTHGLDVCQVHCDSNTAPGCKSTEHTRMLTGYIQSMGYAYLVKPHAWATFVADRHSRDPTRKRGRRAPIFQP